MDFRPRTSVLEEFRIGDIAACISIVPTVCTLPPVLSKARFWLIVGWQRDVIGQASLIVSGWTQAGAGKAAARGCCSAERSCSLGPKSWPLLPPACAQEGGVRGVAFGLVDEIWLHSETLNPVIVKRAADK